MQLEHEKKCTNFLKNAGSKGMHNVYPVIGIKIESILIHKTKPIDFKLGCSEE